MSGTLNTLVMVLLVIGLVTAWWLRSQGARGRTAHRVVTRHAQTVAELRHLDPAVKERVLEQFDREGFEPALARLRDEAQLSRNQADELLRLLINTEIRLPPVLDPQRQASPAATEAPPPPDRA